MAPIIHISPMALFRPLCSLLVALAFMLGTIIPASQAGQAQDMIVSAVEHSMPMDCDYGDDTAPVPMPCGKAFCAGMALLPAPLQGATSLPAVQFDRAPDQSGTGVSRYPDPDPPRTVSLS